MLKQKKEFKSFLKTVQTKGEGGRCNYTTRLDTYGCGCQHDCSYCYAKSLLGFRGLWDATSPSIANSDKINRAIRKVPSGTVVRLGGMTDCFAPIEAHNKVTKGAIDALNKAGLEYLIVTKSASVALDEYICLMDKSLAHIQVSFSSMEGQKSKAIEKCSPVDSRIAAVERLSALGFDVQVRMSPVIPCADYSDAAKDLERLNAIDCDKVLVEFLRVNHWVKKAMPLLDVGMFPVKSGGYSHMELQSKLDFISGILGKSVSVCDDVDEHFMYFKSNINANPDDCCNLSRHKEAVRVAAS